MTSEVLFSQVPGNGGDLGLIELDRPKALNSLTPSMVLTIHQQLLAWEKAKHIKAIIVRATQGRAFCAGGDLRLTYERIKQRAPSVTTFFKEEYQLNAAIYHSPKPYIALLNGITMGGGVGISIHGSHRVATDNLLFAMPETGIGFFPDVGGTYFLPRLPGRSGYYLGLTGARIGVDEAFELGIITHKMTEESLAQVVEALAQHPFMGEADQAVSTVLAAFQAKVTGGGGLLAQQKLIDDCFGRPTMEDILHSLTQYDTPFCRETMAILMKKSPTSLKVTLKALQLGEKLDFDACMRQEYRLVSRFLQQPDFAEGIRAAIIDKDQAPTWEPAALQAVSMEAVEDYFTPLENERGSESI